MNPGGDGAKYWVSKPIGILTRQFLGHPVIASPMPDVIADILAHWVGLFSVLSTNNTSAAIPCGAKQGCSKIIINNGSTHALGARIVGPSRLRMGHTQD